MTQEEKQLLLVDLCGRLPYGVMVRIEGEKYFNETKEPYITNLSLNNYILDYDDVTIIPYLRPMSSMTEEEKTEYHKQVDIDLDRTADGLREQFEAGTFHPENKFTPQYCHIDWLNAHHFDYRGLIPMGLALEALEDMYKTE